MGTVKNFIRTLITHLNKYVFTLVGLLPPKKDVIMFESFLGKQYSDNPRAIYEYIKEHYPEYKLYWSADRKYIKNFENKDIDIVIRFSVRWLFLMARAQFWVTNSRLPFWVPKPKHTTYIQTWHGTPLKKIGVDIEEVRMSGIDTVKYRKGFINAVRYWDYLISPNPYSTKIFRQAFQFNGEFIESGYPRNDYLYNANNDLHILHLKQKYNIPEDKKVILYAPTWRDHHFTENGKYQFKLELDLEQLKERLGDEYIVLLRLHYLIASKLDIAKFKGFAYDFSQFEDIRELYLISDLLITDYSSVFFDYANLQRPIIFFVYDIDEYRDKLRGFYLDFENMAPGPLVKTTEEVIQEIEQLEKNYFKLPNQFEQFYEEYCKWEDGNASKRVVEKAGIVKQ